MRVFLLCLTMVLSTTSAFGWGCEGHQMIALLARTQLTPAASSAVDKLLKENPISPTLSRFCKDRPADIMADLSTWADDARSGEGTGAWHFVDIPMTIAKTPGDKSLDKWCPENGGKDGSGCVTKAILEQWQILKDKTQPAEARARALRYVIHFVEDTHQPLHDSDNTDHGGNCTAVTYLNEEKPANLHAIWDYRILQTDMERRKLSQSAYTAAIGAEFAKRRAGWSKEKVDPEAWAWEGHALAAKLTYGLLRPLIPVEPPGEADCNAERARVAALHISIGEAYIGQSLPVIREQLAHSAARLANLLNQTF